MQKRSQKNPIAHIILCENAYHTLFLYFKVHLCVCAFGHKLFVERRTREEKKSQLGQTLWLIQEALVAGFSVLFCSLKTNL